jgi:D-apionate oxidoisomerase
VSETPVGEARIALVGAGGKMGCRITDNFVKHPLQVDSLEVSTRGIDNLKQRNVAIGDPVSAIPAADVVILAVPDVTMGSIALEVVPRMRSGALPMTLDHRLPQSKRPSNSRPRRPRGASTS